MTSLLRYLAFAFLFGAAPLVAAPTTPEQVVRNITTDLLKQIEGRRDELGRDREALIGVIDGVLLPHFDLDYASLLVLGQHARAASIEQRRRFAKAFYSSIAHRYSEGLLRYTEGRIAVLPAKGDLNPKRSLVRTEVVLDDGKRVPVDYVFRLTKSGNWKAYDVVIEGISYVTNYRNQVAPEIQKSGLDALILRLETRGAEALGEVTLK